MTIKRVIEVLEREAACVARQDTPKCNRDELGCQCCDLILEADEVLEAYRTAIKALKERPTGKWYEKRIDEQYGDPPHGFLTRYEWRCSNCENAPYYASDIHTLYYCPNCGADMRGEEDADDFIKDIRTRTLNEVVDELLHVERDGMFSTDSYEAGVADGVTLAIRTINKAIKGIDYDKTM